MKSSEEVESARDIDAQQSLFPETAAEIAERVGLDEQAIQKLWDMKLLSFDPSTKQQLESAEATELRFLSSLLATGCDEPMFKNLLVSLKYPYQYRVDHIYFDWPKKRWRMIPDLSDIDKDEFLRTWLNEIVDDGDTKTLLQITEMVHDADGRLLVE